MANGFSPYQVASPTTNLISQSNISKKKKQESDLATFLQMGKMEDAYSKETEGLGLSSSKKEAGTKGTRRAENITQLASLFINPLIGGLLGGFIGGKKHKRARKARQGLLNLNEKWGKTFLRNQARDYLSEAESLQLSEGGDFMAGLKGGVTSGLMAKMLGGKVNVGEGKFMSKFGTGEGAIANIFKGENPFKNVGKAGEGATPFDKLFGRDIGTPMKDFITESSESIGSFTTPYEKPGFFDASKLFGGAKGIDTKTLLLLPALLQLFEQDY